MRTHEFGSLDLYLDVIIFTMVRQLYVEVGEINFDDMSFRDLDVPGQILFIRVLLWKLGRSNPSI